MGEKVLILYMLCENKRKERVFLSLTASQLTSRHLTTNPATVKARRALSFSSSFALPLPLLLLLLFDRFTRFFYLYI